MSKDLCGEKTFASKQVKEGATALVLMVMDLNQERSEVMGRRKEIRREFGNIKSLGLLVWQVLIQ